MSIFRRIVVAVDFSEASDAAWRLAARLGGRESNLVALNVVAPPVVPNVAYANIPAAVEEERRQNEARLERLETPGRADSARVERRALTGDVSDTIVATARETAADLLIIGAGPEGGGIVQAVVRDAPCSVLVAKPAA